jgi:serine/threonine-protein kinase RsbW
MAEVDGVEIKMVLYLPRDAASVPVSRQVLDSCLNTLGVAPDTRDDIALALTEACANVIRHAGPGDEYEVVAVARAGQAIIEVVNTGRGSGQAGELAFAGSPVPVTAENGRGLTIMKAVVDKLQLTGNEREGTTVHFEKALQWLPGAPGQQLFSADDGHQEHGHGHQENGHGH